MDTQEKEFLELYSDSNYDKPSVTVDAVIFRLIDKEIDNYRKLPEKKLQVFLTKRKYFPFKDNYAVIGTFIDLGHELSESLRLCVKKKVDLTNFYHEQLFTFGEKQRDPRTRVLSTSYMLLTTPDTQLTNGEWFDIDLQQTSLKQTTTSNGYIYQEEISITLSNENTTLQNTLSIDITKELLSEKRNITITNNALAFDHIKIIYYALERLKNKLEYTDIIFNLLPKEFTLTELKNCYEIILGEKLLDANFRRKTSKLVKPTNNYDSGKGHRSSQLFTFNPFWKLKE